MVPEITTENHIKKFQYWIRETVYDGENSRIKNWTVIETNAGLYWHYWNSDGRRRAAIRQNHAKHFS